MKKVLFILSISVMTLSAWAQDPIYVYVDEDIQNGDTLRTFSVDDFYCEKLIDFWTSEYGTPTGAGSGTLKWTGVSIQGIGNNLSIKANDGAMAFDGQNWTHFTFIDAADMETKLSHDPARYRKMYFTVIKGNKNIIKTEAKEQLMISIAEEVMLDPN